MGAPTVIYNEFCCLPSPLSKLRSKPKNGENKA